MESALFRPLEVCTVEKLPVIKFKKVRISGQSGYAANVLNDEGNVKPRQVIALGKGRPPKLNCHGVMVLLRGDYYSENPISGLPGACTAVDLVLEACKGGFIRPVTYLRLESGYRGCALHRQTQNWITCECGALEDQHIRFGFLLLCDCAYDSLEDCPLFKDWHDDSKITTQTLSFVEVFIKRLFSKASFRASNIEGQIKNERYVPSAFIE